MKKKILLGICFVFILCLMACNSASENNKKENSKEEASEKTKQSESQTNVTKNNVDKKIAVVYFSGTGNTKKVANMIAVETTADIFEINPAIKYSDSDLDYNDDNCRANKEMNDESARPAIKNDMSTVKDYDVIYIGYPIWWGTAPRIIQTFLESYDLSSATIYTFCTSGGSGIEKSLSDLKTLYPKLNIVDGKMLNNANESDIKEWINNIS